MDILVYTRNERVEEFAPHFEARFEDRSVAFRNAGAHERGQVEDCALVCVDDRYPLVAEDYRESDAFEGRVELFDANEVGAPEPPEPEGGSEGLDPDAFASPTAHDAAVEGGLGPDDLEGVEPRGKTGYTTAQIREMVD